MKKRKYFLLVAVIILSAVNSFSQIATVSNEVTREPVANAVITSKLPAPNIRLWSATTNAKGEVDISAIADADSIYVRHTKYGTQGFSMEEIKNNKFKIYLHEKSFTLEEVVFSASKTEEKKSETPYSITVVTDKQISFSNPQTSADMLQNTGGVFVQKSQMGGGSPVLRGFESNRVLIVVDGVRMNNAIYRSGHVQDVITIDPNMLARTEVLFGPSSVIYGSDALGGTMHFYSKKPLLSPDTVTLVRSNAMLRSSSANNELTAHFDLNFGGQKWASLTSITRSDYGDLRMGRKANPFFGNFGWCTKYVEQLNGSDTVLLNNDPYLQRNTGYSQLDFTQKIFFLQNEKVSHLLNFQFSTSSDIPRYDRLAQMDSNGDPVYAEWNYGPQKRMLGSYAVNVHGDSSLYDNASIIFSAQLIGQDRITRRLYSENRRSQNETVSVYAVNADFRKSFKEKHELRYGIEFTYNDVQSKATSTNIPSNTETPTDTRYPDGGSTMFTGAVYISHIWKISPKLILTDGFRFSYIGLKANWADTSIFNLPFSEAKQNNLAPGGTLGISWLPTERFRFHANVSTGFRAPNVDDLGKIFESAPGLLFVPNVNLKPEMAIGGEAGIDWEFSPGAKIDFTAFYSLLNNAIVTKDFQFNGADSVLYDGELSKVQASQNADKAFIYGYTTGLTADFNEHFSFRGSLTYTYGRYENVENDTLIPMDHIPPLFGQAGLSFHSKGFEAEIFTRFNGWKRLVDYSPSGEDNLNQATPFGMPDWATVNFRSEYNINKHIGINFSVENIFDINYRHFASGVSAPGRNFILAVRAHF